MKSTLLTTEDNPFHPDTQFDQWDQWDKDSGYHTCAYLARIVKTSNDMSQADYDEAVEQAIDSIIKLNITGNYKKIVINE